MRRRRADEPLPSNERWMLSWSDFVTLLLAVFAAMYAGASVDLAKAKAVAGSVGKALHAPAWAAASANISAGVDPRTQASNALEKDLAAALASLGLSERISLRRDGNTIGLDIDAELLFAEGDARISAQASQLLASLAQILRDRHCAIRVEGHTDTTPISNARFASNWELSAARAAVVVRRLISAGIDESRLSAMALAANQPLASNYNEAGRLRNRRVHLSLSTDD